MYVDPAYVTKQVSLVDKPAPRDFEQAALKKGPDNWKLANKKITAFQEVLKQNVNNVLSRPCYSEISVQLWQHVFQIGTPILIRSR